jgi:hypothetical protein
VCVLFFYLPHGIFTETVPMEHLLPIIVALRLKVSMDRGAVFNAQGVWDHPSETGFSPDPVSVWLIENSFISVVEAKDMISDPFRAPESNAKTLRRRTQKRVLEQLVSQALDCKIREGNHNRARCA